MAHFLLPLTPKVGLPYSSMYVKPSDHFNVFFTTFF